MKSPRLKQLKQSFEPYLSFWEEWKTNEVSELLPHEIRLINSKLRNNFSLSWKDYIFSAKSSEQYIIITNKLDQTIVAYQDFVIERFQSRILSVLRTNFEQLPYVQLAELPISKEEIKILYRFEYDTIKDIFSHIREKEFRKPHLFPIVLEFTSMSNSI